MTETTALTIMDSAVKEALAELDKLGHQHRVAINLGTAWWLLKLSLDHQVRALTTTPQDAPDVERVEV